MVEKNVAFRERKKLSLGIKILHRAQETGEGAFAMGRGQGSRENTGAVEVDNQSLGLPRSESHKSRNVP